MSDFGMFGSGSGPHPAVVATNAGPASAAQTSSRMVDSFWDMEYLQSGQ
jgi:hypothetical protein